MMIFRNYLLLALLSIGGICRPIRAGQPTGTAVAPVPSLSYSQGEGVEFGGKIFVYHFGDGSIQPYRWSTIFNAARTTRDKTDLYIFTDLPQMFGANSRLDFRIDYKDLQLENYYGLGNHTAYRPEFTDRTDPSYRSEDYYNYKRRTAAVTLNAQIPFFFPRLRLLVGLGFSRTRTTAYDEPNRFSRDLPFGVQGGRSDYYRIGLVLDRRDQETLPHRGVWSDVLFESAGRMQGSDYDYTRLTLTHRSYVQMHPRLVFVNRTLLEMMSGNPPFYEMAVISGSYQRWEGLGGSRSLRGVPRLLFVGPDKLISNFELRWRISQFSVLQQELTWYLHFFGDAGRVYMAEKELTLKDLHFSEGIGLAVQWKKDFVGAIEIGRSPYLSRAVYLSFGTIL